MSRYGIKMYKVIKSVNQIHCLTLSAIYFQNGLPFKISNSNEICIYKSIWLKQYQLPALNSMKIMYIIKMLKSIFCTENCVNKNNSLSIVWDYILVVLLRYTRWQRDSSKKLF